MGSFKKILVSALVCSVFAAGSAFANEAGVKDEFENEDVEWLNVVPSSSFWGLRGLTQTVSAEPLGAGRFSLGLYSSYFKQKQKGLISPVEGAHVNTWRGSFSWGLNDNIDLFGVVPFYILADDNGARFSYSGLLGGIQYAFPFPAEIPFRLALQAHIVTGLRIDDSRNEEITSNQYYWRDSPDGHLWDERRPLEKMNYAGYDFWDAPRRDQNDAIFKVSQSIVHGNLRRAFKIHLNEGIVITQGAKEYLFLLAGGIQIDPTEFMTIGLEANLRTRMNELTFTDPFWITPSLMFRTPYYNEGLFGMNFVVGMDFCASAAKKVPEYNLDPKSPNYRKPTGLDIDNMKPLEPWRIFGDMVFSFDRFASQRTEIERERRRSEAERARLKREAQLSGAQRDSIARKAREDSLRQAEAAAMRAAADSLRARHLADSLAAAMGDLSEKARLDSIAHAQREAELMASADADRAAAEAKRVADSIAFAKQLAEERAKRSDAEQNLLSTGMIVLDAVYFQTGKTDIHLNSKPYLSTIAKMLVKYPKLKIEIGGHSDNTGSRETNLNLSQKRAEAVVMFMITADANLAQMLSAKGYGPDLPKADNNTAAGREMNRRVELKVLNPEVLKDYNP